MYSEIQEAVNYLLTFLYERVPRRKVLLLGEQLANFILLKYQDHWHPAQPDKEVDYRILRINDGNNQADPVFGAATASIGLELKEVLQLWPKELTLSINPGAVYCRIGNVGHPFLLGSAPTPPSSPLKLTVTGGSKSTSNWALNEEVGKQQQVFELSSPSDLRFTAGSFAMTRFGTTKVKTEPPRRMLVPPAMLGNDRHKL